jgi:hypothetical protein
MKYFAGGFFALAFLCAAAQGQGVISDVFSGSLVNPKVGAWAWYDVNGGLTADGGVIRLGAMRLAIVGEEKVRDKQGYWLEMEYVPSVGYSSVYRMLLTGPAKDPANVHKMFRREGLEKKQEVSLKSENNDEKEKAKPSEGKKDDNAAATAPEPAKEPERKLAGEEDIATAGGEVHAQHYEVADDNGKIDVWLNESVCPMGIVQMKSEDGNLLLRNYGSGGPDARSVIDEPPPTAGKDAEGGAKVDVRVEKEPKRTTPPKPSKGRP